MNGKKIFTTFKEQSRIKAERSSLNADLIKDLDVTTVAFFYECGGRIVDEGIYKTHTIETSLHWAILIANYFSKYTGKIIPFGYDWMGRQFAIDRSRSDYVLMFDPSTGEDFEINQNIDVFHNHDLVYEKESFLSDDLFHKGLKKINLNSINYNDCIGFKVPLFLGGSDEINNYKLYDLEVYWEMQCQIYLQIKDLPPGTKINSIKWKENK